jgi:Arc/MetJ-type ribon-helix-helix transcriptional regulator
MSYAFSGELQRLVETELARGIYANEDELLLVALKSLRDREEEFGQFRAEIQGRIDSLDRGEGIELDDEQALRHFASEIKAEGRRYLEVSREEVMVSGTDVFGL